jgi:hypothetical protein
MLFIHYGTGNFFETDQLLDQKFKMRKIISDLIMKIAKLESISEFISENKIFKKFIRH